MTFLPELCKKESFVDVFFFPAPFVYLAFIHCVVVSVMKLKTLQCKKRKQTTENERPLTLQEQPGLSVHAKCWVLKMATLRYRKI